VRFSKAAAALIFTVGALATRPALATEEDAKTFFAEGRRLRMAGDCVNSIVSFRRALEIYPEGLGSLRNIAECEEQIGQYASARIDWWALRRAALQSNEAKYQGWEKDAEAGYNRLNNKVGKLTVKIEGERLERVRIIVDGKPLDPRLYGVPLERDLGPHNIEATYGGASPLVVKRDLKEGGDEVVMLSIPSLSAAANEVDSTTKAHAPPGSLGTVDRGATYRTVGFVSLGIGAASLVGGAIALGIRQSALSDLNGKCAAPYQNCPSSVRSIASRGTAAATADEVLFTIGAVGAVAGVSFLIAGYRLKSSSSGLPTTGTLTLTPTLGGGFAKTEVSF
jgi:hypothetical protein